MWTVRTMELVFAAALSASLHFISIIRFTTSTRAREVCVKTSLFATFVTLSLSGCGAVCVSGVGHCEFYKNWPSSSPTTGSTGRFSLSVSSKTAKPGDRLTVKLTSAESPTSSASCSWSIAEGVNNVGGDIEPDTTPAVNSLCSALFVAGEDLGKATIKVSEKTSGGTFSVSISIAH